MAALARTVATAGVLFLPAPEGRAQGPAGWIWAQQHDVESTVDVGADRSGSVYITGRFSGTLEPGGPGCPADLVCSYVARRDGSNRLVWGLPVTPLGGMGSSPYFKIAVDPSGHWTAVARLDGTVSVDGRVVSSDDDVLLVRGGPDGRVLWTHLVVDTTQFYHSWVATDGAGNTHVLHELLTDDWVDDALTFEGTGGPLSFPFPATTTALTGTPRIFLARYDAAGNVVWARQVATASWSVGAQAFAVDPSGRSVFTGVGARAVVGGVSFPDDGEQVRHYDYLARFDAAGDPMWTRVHSVPYDMYEAASLTADDQGNTYEAGQKTPAPGQPTEPYVREFDPAGNVTWERNPGGRVYDLAFGPGGLYAGGLRASSGESVPWVARLDGAGNVAWSAIGTASLPSVGNVDVLAVGGESVFATGRFSGTLQLGSTVLGSGSEAAFLARLGTFEVEVTSPQPTVHAPATSIVTATVVLRNPASTPVGPIRLTLVEGEGALYALKDDTDSGRFGTIEGVSNAVYFDALSFGPGEQKTFQVPILVAPLFDEVDPQPRKVTATFEASLEGGPVLASSAFQVVVDPITDVEDASAFADLLTKPVADLGTSPGSPLGAARVPRVAAVYPSDTGDLWSLYVVNSMDKWNSKDRVLYFTLKRAGFSAKASYAAVYLRSLLELRPSGGCVPSRTELGKASVKFWWALQKAKWTGQENAFYSAFESVAKGLGNCNALYPMNLLELHDAYTTPLANAMEDSFARFAMNRSTMELQICSYIFDDQAMTVPLPRLVEADVDYYLARRQWYSLLHNGVLAQVDVRDGESGTILLGSLIQQQLDPGSGRSFPCDMTQARPRHGKQVSIQVHSPLLPVVSDPLGRASGVDTATGALYEEIPHAVLVPGHPWELILPATTGSHPVKWTTGYPYDFGIDYAGISDGAVTSTQSFTGTAITDSQATQTAQVTVTANAVTVTVGGLSDTTPGPVVTTLPATSVTGTDARLEGTVDPGGLATTAKFEYGLLGLTSSTATQSVGSGAGAVGVGATITGLTCDTTYHYRIVGANASGTRAGNTATFRSGSCEPTQDAKKFYTVSLCRVLDTRDPAGPLGGPVLAPGQSRTFVVAGTCGVPATARSVSVNVTVTGPAGDGFFTLYPGNGSLPLASNINFRTGQTRANNALLTLATDGAGSIAIRNGSAGAAHVILDVNGYFE